VNLRKLKTMRIVKTRKNKKVSKSAATIKVSESMLQISVIYLNPLYYYNIKFLIVAVTR